MDRQLLAWIRCPTCGSHFQSHRGELPGGRPGYDILRCRCRRYPVIEGIPILKAGLVGSEGETADDLVTLLEARRYQDALLAVLMPSPPPAPALAPSWITRRQGLKGLWRLSHWLHSRAVPRWRAASRQALRTHPLLATAEQFFDLYFNRIELRPEAYNYFLFRHGMPRHLVALSLIQTIGTRDHPVLDVACGFGQVTRSAAAQVGGWHTVGVDSLFFCLYVASRCVAREGHYVCCDVEDGLPFASGVFRTIVCSDAFHYFEAKNAVMSDFLRLLKYQGRVLIPSMRNASVSQLHRCRSLTAQGYRDLAKGGSYRLVSDRLLLRRYLAGMGAALAASEPGDVLDREPLLSMVVSDDEAVFRDHETFRDWPHAHGSLQVNPLYRCETAGERVRLRRVFPSTFYEEENVECREYLPEDVEVRAETLNDVQSGKRTEAVNALIRQCVVLGMPAHYLQPCRPSATAAGRQ